MYTAQHIFAPPSFLSCAHPLLPMLLPFSLILLGVYACLKPPAVQKPEELEDLKDNAQVRLMLWLGFEKDQVKWTEHVVGELSTFAETVSSSSSSSSSCCYLTFVCYYSLIGIRMHVHACPDHIF